MKKKQTKNRKTSASRRRKSSHQSHHLHPVFHRYPRWAWWVGGIGVVVVYVWLFYYFFVSPTGFRWRALYGDARYPDGYEIHGIDISHYQASIEWDKLRHAMIEGCPLRFIIVKSTEGASLLDEKFDRSSTRSSMTISMKPANTVSFAAPIISGAIARRHATRPTSSSRR